MRPTEPIAETKPEELLRVAQEYADLFNARPLEDIERLIADACVDPLWDDRTNLFSLGADEPEDLGLVLALDDEEYVVVRYVGAWVVDIAPVDWEALENEAFDPTGYDDDPPPCLDVS
jgi:hypothetical protein